MPLSLAPHGVGLKIVKIAADEKVKKHLGNLGLTVGECVVPMSGSAGNVIIRVKDGRLALNRELAMKIFVN